MVKVPSVLLNNGNKMPAMGMGVVFLDSEGKTQETVDRAIECGYRLFDNAAFYGNEEAIGQALKNNGIPREELFISSKLKNGHHRYDDALYECEKSLKRLQVDYLDLYLIHFPCPEHGLYTEAWKALEHLYKEGVVRNIGVSNFHQSHLERIFDMCEFKPVVNQLECNPYLTIDPLRAFLREHDIVTEAWFPLGGPAVKLDGGFSDKSLMSDPVILELAQKYNRSPAQIILRWEVQSGIIVIPKAANPVHMRENISIFDFELSLEDMSRVHGLNCDYRCGPSGDSCNEYWD